MMSQILVCFKKKAGKFGSVSFLTPAISALLSFIIFFEGTNVAAAPFKTHTKVSLISENEVVALGDSFDVGILLQMKKGWHTYSDPSGDSGMPTSIEWNLPARFSADPIRWPKPEKITAAGLTTYGYENEVLLPIKIRVPKEGYHNGQAIVLKARVEWLECADVCIPGSAELSIPLRIGNSAKPASKDILNLFKKYRELTPSASAKSTNTTPQLHSTAEINPFENLPQDPTPESQNPRTRIIKAPPSVSLILNALLGAFLGGIILNLMPCVLPVIAIKILGFVKQSGDSQKRTRRLGFLFGLGVLVSFWCLAAAVISLQKAGQQVGWGSLLFQEPWFLMLMTAIVILITLNFFGLFEIELGSSALNRIGNLASRQGAIGAFLNGVLATALATPCTAPFMATALGFAFAQSPSIILAVLTSLGAGLAFPYVLLSWNPHLLKWLPKPGPWMVRLKQFMGIPMFATAIWLLSILRSHDATGASIFAGWLAVISIAVWIVGKIRPGKLIWIIVSVALIGFAAYRHVSPRFSQTATTELNVSKNSLIPWKPYSSSALQEALATTDRPIFIDFTAAWCLTCQANKRTSLEVESVAKRFKDLGVTAFLADRTKSNLEIDEAITGYGRVGVPVYVVYPTDRSKPHFLLPEILTPGMVIDAIEKAAAKTPAPQ
jgi:thiol:disulfide interchange protein